MYLLSNFFFSCEAIPEEISDATPPKHSQISQQPLKAQADGTVPVVASGTVKNQQNDFIAKSNAGSTKGTQNSSADSLTPFSQGAAVPRKQHSADDALQQQKQEQTQSRLQQAPSANEQRHSSSGSAINIGASSSKFKLNIDMPNLATKPPQSHAPLSPRLLARNNVEISHLNNSNNFNDFQRGRSKTISVVRGEHDTNRDNSKWTFKGSKCSSSISRYFDLDLMVTYSRIFLFCFVARSVLSPSSIFLQLFHTGPTKVTEQPLLINSKHTRTVE